MSEQNLAVARRWVELFNDRSDLAEFLSLLAPDVEIVSSPPVAKPSPRVGRRRRARSKQQAWRQRPAGRRHARRSRSRIPQSGPGSWARRSERERKKEHPNDASNKGTH